MSDVDADLARCVRSLEKLVAARIEPCLTIDDLRDLLLSQQRMLLYALSTAYNVNDRVVPSPRTGRAYRCIQAGTSGTTPPCWYRQVYRQRMGQRFLDGDSVLGVVWEDDGPEDIGFFDVHGAAHDGWMQKAAMVAHQIDFASADQKFTLSQQYQHCLDMAACYAPVYVV